jgi:hypothetical protein
LNSHITRQFIPPFAALSLPARTCSNRSLTPRPTQPCLAVFLSLLFLGVVTACGPASSDNPPSPSSRASGNEPIRSKQNLTPGSKPVVPIKQESNPMPLASGSETSRASGKGTVPVGDSPQAIPVSASTPAEVLEPMVVPTWIAKDLESPDIGTRLRALDKWVQTAPPGADDPLILALENTDERVRARAMELIEQNWARAADAEQ